MTTRGKLSVRVGGETYEVRGEFAYESGPPLEWMIITGIDHVTAEQIAECQSDSEFTVHCADGSSYVAEAHRYSAHPDPKREGTFILRGWFRREHRDKNVAGHDALRG